MSRKFRTLLFIFFALLFAVAAPGLLMYAQGYRINWPLEAGKKLVVMTGGFFVRVSPKQAGIYVDGNLKKETDFFFDSALVENLLPRQYEFEVKKTGYQAWKKKLEIKEKEVTETRNIILFPNRTEFAGIAKNIDGILLSPDGQKIALREKEENGWSLKFYDIQQNITVKLADQNNFSGKNAAFASWRWADAKTLEVLSNSASASSTYAIAIDKNPPRITKKTQTGATSTLAATEISVQDKYFLGQDGFVYKNGNSGNPIKAGPAQITLAPDSDRKLWVFGDYFFVRSGSDLYEAKSSLESFEKIFSGLSGDPKLSPDGKKAVYSSDSEIWVFFLADKTSPPPASAGDKIFIARLSEKIANCDWFNSDYLVFTAGNNIKTAEIDNRDRINIANIASFSDIGAGGDFANPQMIWNENQKSACLFLGSTLYKSKPIQ